MINILTSNIIINALIMLLLIWMSIYDIKYLKTKNTYLIALFVLQFWYMLVNFEIEKIIISFLFSFLLFIFLYIFYYFFEDKFGGGDIKVIILLSLTLSKMIIYLLFLGSFLGLTLIVILKKEKIPFIPCITMAYIVLYVTNIFTII